MTGCTVPNCFNSSLKGFKVYRFPSDEERCSIWIQNCGKGPNWKPTKHTCICEVHFDNSQFELNRADGHRKLKPNAIPTLFNPSKLTKTHGKLINSSYMNYERQSYTENYVYSVSDDETTNVVHVRASDEVRGSFIGRQTSVRGRRRGRPRKRLDDDLDEWTPDKPRAVRGGRKRGRPPASNTRGKSSSPVRKTPRGRGRWGRGAKTVVEIPVEPSPAPLSGPRPRDPNVVTGVRCFVCNKLVDKGTQLNTLTSTTKVHLHHKLGKMVGAELDLIVDEDGVLCSLCLRMVNYVDRIEAELVMLNKTIIDSMRRTFGFNYPQTDRVPVPLLPTITQHVEHLSAVDKYASTSKDSKPQASVRVLESSQDNEVTELDTVGKNKENVESITSLQIKSDKQISDKPFVCKLCKFKTKHKSLFVFHLRQHVKATYRCDFCNVYIPRESKNNELKNIESSNTKLDSHKDQNTASINQQHEMETPARTTEVQDYVETMIEELHTTGIVTTMNLMDQNKAPMIHDNSTPSCNDEVGKISIDHNSIIHHENPELGQGTFNIIVTYPGTKSEENITISQDAPANQVFNNDAVVRELRNIFGSFNEESLEESEPSELAEKENISLMETESEVSHMTAIPVLQSNKINVSNSDSSNNDVDFLTKHTVLNTETESINSDEDKRENVDHNSEEKYQKQLALLDEMGLIMLPKKSRMVSEKETNNDSNTLQNENVEWSDTVRVKGQESYSSANTTIDNSVEVLGKHSMEIEKSTWLTDSQETKVVQESNANNPHWVDSTAVESNIPGKNLNGNWSAEVSDNNKPAVTSEWLSSSESGIACSSSPSWLETSSVSTPIIREVQDEQTEMGNKEEWMNVDDDQHNRWVNSNNSLKQNASWDDNSSMDQNPGKTIPAWDDNHSLKSNGNVDNTMDEINKLVQQTSNSCCPLLKHSNVEDTSPVVDESGNVVSTKGASTSTKAIHDELSVTGLLLDNLNCNDKIELEPTSSQTVLKPCDSLPVLNDSNDMDIENSGENYSSGCISESLPLIDDDSNDQLGNANMNFVTGHSVSISCNKKTEDLSLVSADVIEKHVQSEVKTIDSEMEFVD